MIEEFQYTQENLRKLQLAECTALQELDRICRRNDIKYIIDAGTLLGAVRHGGFIPWDDDIDIRMLRPEYNRFVEICEKELDKRFFLQTYDSDPGYRWGYARMLLVGSRYQRRDHEMLKSKTGIFIDIFPNDPIPDNPFGRAKVTFLSLLARKMLYSEVGKIAAKSRLKRFGFSVLDIFPKKWAYHIYESMEHKYAGVKTQKVRCYGWGSPEETGGFDRDWFENVHDQSFEYLTCLAPVHTHEFLVCSFGEDYMIPPPENERVVRHPAGVITFPDWLKEEH